MFNKKAVVSIIAVLLLTMCFGGAVFADDTPSAEAIKGTPVIDGEMDDIWESANAIVPDIYKEGNADINAKAKVYTMWDEDNLYIFADVQDEIVVNLSSGGTVWQGDCLEFFVDELYLRTGQWANSTSEGQWLVNVNNEQDVSRRGDGSIKGGGYEGRTITSAVKKRDDGYSIEVAFPWVEIKGKVDIGTKIGFQLQIDDDSTAMGVRDGVLRWAADNAQSSNWGTVTMVAGPAPAEETKTETQTPAATTPIPKTGDSTAIIFAAAALSGSVALYSVRKKLKK